MTDWPRAQVIISTFLYSPSEQKNWSLLVLVLEEWDSPIQTLSAEVCCAPGSLPKGLWHSHAARPYPTSPRNWDATKSHHWHQVTLCWKVWRQFSRYSGSVSLVLFPNAFISMPSCLWILFFWRPNCRFPIAAWTLLFILVFCLKLDSKIW